MDFVIGHYVPTKNFPQMEREFVEPNAGDYFIWWLFKHKCIMCKHPATEINEIIPRARSKKSILNWRNRITLCHLCHSIYHLAGVTKKKIEIMEETRKNFLISMDRSEYI